MLNSAKTEAPAHEPSSVKDAKWWLHKIADNAVPIVIASVVAGTFVYQFEEARYKDITDGLHTQNGTQAATIKNEDATITQLREQLKGTSPELAAIQANRDKIRGALQNFYVQGGELFRRKVSDEPSLNKWLNDANSWVNETGMWITENMGQAAGEKFVDQGNSGDVGWGDSFNQIHTNGRNMVARFRRNLSTLIETAAWDGRSEKMKQ
jgi:hypothetical protein